MFGQARAVPRRAIEVRSSMLQRISGSVVSWAMSNDYDMNAPYAGDPLHLISQLASEVAHELAAEYAPDRLHEPDNRYAMLDRARTLLMLNARHVPVVVDEILEMALAQGGYKP